jgi:hypothetical protein
LDLFVGRDKVIESAREIENFEYSSFKGEGTVNENAKHKFVEKGEWPGFIQKRFSQALQWCEKRDRVLLLIVRAEWAATKQGMCTVCP